MAAIDDETFVAFQVCSPSMVGMYPYCLRRVLIALNSKLEPSIGSHPNTRTYLYC
jgi:hypothetical protein